MNTHDKYELPPLPDLPAYSPEVFDREVKVVSETMAEQLMHDYARAAIEADRKRTADLISAYQAKVRTLEADNYALISELDDRQRKGAPVAWPADILIAAEMAIEDAEDDEDPTLEIHASRIVESLSAPQPSEPVSQHPDDAAVDAFAAAMKAKLAKKRAEGRGNWQMCTSTYLSRLLREHVEKGDPVDVANLAMMLHQNGQRIEPAAPSGAQTGIQVTQSTEPVKSHLKVSYDDYGDCLYVVCDSNEPSNAEEDDTGILYRHAISDGRLVGVTIMDFMGRHAASSTDVQRPAEPEPCFCDRMYPDSNPDATCGDCPTRDYKNTTEPVKVPNAWPSGTNYSVEPHGNGYAIYQGRDGLHHGANLAHLTECTPEFSKRIESALNAMSEPVKNDVDALTQERAALQSQDREDAERYRWLCEKFGITKLPCAIERIIGGDIYVADGKAGIDEAIDHARRIEGGGK